MVLSSATAPCLSGQLQREQNETERETSDKLKRVFSVPVVPVDSLTDTDDRIDIRTIQRVG